MCDWIKWDADEVSQGIRILEGASQSLAANTVEIPSGFGQNQDNLTEKSFVSTQSLKLCHIVQLRLGKASPERRKHSPALMTRLWRI